MVTHEYRFAPIPEELIYDSTVDHLSVRIYGVLIRHGVAPTSCFPSHSRIAECIGVSARSVQRPLRALEDSGWVTRVPRFDRRGNRTSDGFHVHSYPVAPAGGAQLSAPPAQLSAVRARSSARSERAGQRGQGNESNVNESQLNDSPACTPDAPPPKPEPALAGRIPSTHEAIALALEATPKAVDSDDVRALCKHLRERVGQHHPSGHKPPASAQWVRDMGTLLNSGPAEQENRRVDAAEVRAMTDLIFDKLNVPESRGFCWANQVRSPGALRRHWGAIELALTARQKPGSNMSDDETIAAMAAMTEALDG